MAMHMDHPVAWQKSMSLDRGHLNSCIINATSSALSLPLDNSKFRDEFDAKSPFLYSARLKQSLQESRKAFLNLSLYPGDIDCQDKAANAESKEDICEDGVQEQRKAAGKKITYKIKRTSSLLRKSSSRITTLKSSTVAELASKFDKLVTEKKSILDDPKFARIVKRANSQRSNTQGDVIKVTRKPSVKMKQPLKTEEKTVYISRRPSLVRKVSIKKLQKTNSLSKGDKACVRAKISYLEKPHLVNEIEETDKIKQNSSIRVLPSIPAKPTQMTDNISVRTAIEIFEKRTTPIENESNKPRLVPKPKVPEKKFNLKTIDLISRNSNKKFIVLERASTDNADEIDASEQIDNLITKSCNIPEQTKKLNATERNEEVTNDEKTDFEVPVQIINIPIAPPKRCDSAYETFRIKKAEAKIQSVDITDVSGAELKPNSSFLWRHSDKPASPATYDAVESPESDEDGKQKQDCDDCQKSNRNVSNSWEDLYDFVDSTLSQSPRVVEKPPTVPPRPNNLNLDMKPSTAPRKILKKKLSEPKDHEEKIYEELSVVQKESVTISHNYEYCKPTPKYEDLEQKSDDGYEAVNPVLVEDKENIYETLPSRKVSPPPLLPRRQEEPLPPRPPSKSSYYTTLSSEEVSNCYESIYNVSTVNLKVGRDNEEESNYESIYGCQLTVERWGSGSNRDSIISSDQQSNSLYGRSIPSWTEDVLNYKTTSVSSSERSDDWIDLSDNEEDKVNPGFILIREKPKISKKTSAWSQQLREQWTKNSKRNTPDEGDSDSDHHYESLYNGHGESHFDSDSFDSDSDSSYKKVNIHDSGVDMANTQLPEPPNNQTYVLTRLAASAGRHMKRLRRNWSMTKSDITKSLSRMTKRKSRTDLDAMDPDKSKEHNGPPDLPQKNQKPNILTKLDPNLSEAVTNITQEIKSRETSLNAHSYQNITYTRSTSKENGENTYEKQRSSQKKGFLKKFRRSMSMSAESASELTQNLSKPKSTFYLTEIDIENDDKGETETRKNSLSPATVKAKSKSSPVRPQNPPPPLPTLPPQLSPDIEIRKLNKNDPKRATSWYAEVGLFNNSEAIPNGPKRPNTFWYAEVGLYQAGLSTPSSSSAENSGNGNLNNKNELDTVNQDNSDEYYNLKNENDYYNNSIGSCSSGDTKVDKSLSSMSGDMQLLLQEEPLYQFYDAAVMESVCQGGTSDLDYDGYEEVGGDQIISEQRPRPTAMELISPVKNSMSVSRTLWCEIPEVRQSTVLSTLSLHQKKVQEAKFEMMTSEASYLNSLNVLTNHFIKNLCNSECLANEEKEILFGKIPAVKNCSEKLLQDLEKCWQDNILLHDVCEIVHKHAEENFYVYVTYCENQIKLDSSLRKLKIRPNFYDTLQQLESSTACQALTLYSFLMLPMQRITRWPLLLDAVLKRLSPQDDEYLSCQYALTTINKIVNQCNEGARKVERESEMREIVDQIEFPKEATPVQLISGTRWLIRSGPVTQMVSRGDDMKLTFGKRFTKTPLFLFLFSDLFLVTKYRSNEDNYLVLHYCPRSLVEINKDSIPNLPAKDSQGRNLIFLTILENQDEKLVELLLSCNSDSDKERWLSAILPRQSEDPEETLYECWDCPQVAAIHNYTADQPDELPVTRGDIINVNRKMADGWYYGERIRDGQIGWFPSNYVEEIANPHVRARNLKQRYRLLAFSESYLKTK